MIVWVNIKRGVIESDDGRLRITTRRGRAYLTVIATGATYSHTTKAQARRHAKGLR